jgi:hypothetical protein
MTPDPRYDPALTGGVHAQLAPMPLHGGGGLATVQYYWDVSSYADLYLFADVGRVYASYDDLTLHGMRAGFGPGIEVHSSSQFLVEAYLGFSIDGNVTVSAAFTPIVDRRAHWW